jgi:hypothetical protein
MTEITDVKTGEEVKQWIIDELPTDMGDVLETCKILTAEEAEHVYHDLCLGENFDQPFTRSRALLADNTPDADDGPGEGPADERNLEMGC